EPGHGNSCIDEPSIYAGVRFNEQIIRQAAQAAGHPLPATDGPAPPPGGTPPPTQPSPPSTQNKGGTTPSSSGGSGSSSDGTGSGDDGDTSGDGTSSSTSSSKKPSHKPSSVLQPAAQGCSIAFKPAHADEKQTRGVLVPIAAVLALTLMRRQKRR